MDIDEWNGSWRLRSFSFVALTMFRARVAVDFAKFRRSKFLVSRTTILFADPAA